jgi:hypothetical protein
MIRLAIAPILFFSTNAFAAPLFTIECKINKLGAQGITSGSHTINCEETSTGCRGSIDFTMDGQEMFIGVTDSATMLKLGTTQKPGNFLTGILVSKLPNNFMLFGDSVNIACDKK